MPSPAPSPSLPASSPARPRGLAVRFAALLASTGLVVVACGGEPAKSQWDQQEQVSANSAHDKRAAAEAPKDEPKPATPDEGPAETTLVADTTPEAKADALKREGGAVSRKDCETMIDRYIDLLVKSDDRLGGLGPEAIAMAKSQAKSQKGDPCTDEKLTKKKYKCAMAAKTKEKWERCVE